MSRERTIEAREIWDPNEALWSGIEMLGGPVNAHTHLDRAGTITRDSFPLVNARLQEKWSIVDEIKAQSSVQEIYDRMALTVERLRVEGTKVIGSFIDVDPVVGDKAMRAADVLRETYKGEITFVFANQTLKGVCTPEARAWFEYGAAWADIVGGLPGKDSPHEEEHIEIILQTAKEMGKMAHVHVDQLNTTCERETELLARKTIEAGMQSRVVAIHAISLAAHENAYREYVYSLMQRAGMMAISCPNAWINSRRTEQMAVTHNAVTPVDEMRRWGIPVAIGSDNIFDVYMPYNDGLMRDEVHTLLEATHMYDPDYLALVATLNGRVVLGLIPDISSYQI